MSNFYLCLIILVAKENQSSNVTKNKHRSPNQKCQTVDALTRRSSLDPKSPGKHLAPKKLQVKSVKIIL